MSDYTVENPEPLPDGWPKPPEPEVWHGAAGRLALTCTPFTEADPVAILLQALALFGHQIGRRAHFIADGAVHNLNLFAVLVGESSRSRKGTSFAHVRRLFALADPTLDCRVQSGLSSGEGLIWAVRDQTVKHTDAGNEVVDAGVADKRLLVYEPEFAKVLRVMTREGSILSGVVREAWESGKLQTMTKNQPARASNAHISIIGHITQSELRRELTATESANGFGNRFLWLGVRRSKLLPDGASLPAEYEAAVVEDLREALAFADQVDRLRRDADANRLWRAEYPRLVRSRVGLLDAITSRSEAHVMRLACLYALSNGSGVIREADLISALSLWDYLVASGAWIFGDSIGDAKADECLRVLRAAGQEGVTRTGLMDHFGRNLSADRLTEALKILKRHRLAYCAREPSPDTGRLVERWFVEDGVPAGRN